MKLGVVPVHRLEAGGALNEYFSLPVWRRGSPPGWRPGVPFAAAWRKSLGVIALGVRGAGKRFAVPGEAEEFGSRGAEGDSGKGGA